MSIRHILLPVAVIAVTCSTGIAGITLGTPILVDGSGLGFGNAPPVLTLSGDPSESGSVSWNGTADVLMGTAVVANKTETVTAAEIQAEIGQSNLGISFNINEDGNPKQVSLDDLTVTLFYVNATNDMVVSTQTASISPGTLVEPGGGQGGDGYFFPLTQMTNELDMFFANGNNRLGIAANITGSGAGAESFRVAAAVPEPSALLCLGLLSCLATIRSSLRRAALHCT